MDLFVKFLESLSSSTNLLPVVIVMLVVSGWLAWSRRKWQEKAAELREEKEERQSDRIQDQKNLIEVLRREQRRSSPNPPTPKQPKQRSNPQSDRNTE